MAEDQPDRQLGLNGHFESGGITSASAPYRTARVYCDADLRPIGFASWKDK